MNGERKRGETAKEIAILVPFKVGYKSYRKKKRDINTPRKIVAHFEAQEKIKSSFRKIK